MHEAGDVAHATPHLRIAAPQARISQLWVKDWT